MYDIGFEWSSTILQLSVYQCNGRNRYYFYEKWASQYPSRALLLVTDFRYVLFQSDPFSYRRQEWLPEYQLVVFQEFHPNMVIGRSSFQRATMQDCFGDDALRLYSNRVVISAGAFLGSRDGILLWTHHMTMVRFCPYDLTLRELPSVHSLCLYA